MRVVSQACLILLLILIPSFARAVDFYEYRLNDVLGREAEPIGLNNGLDFSKGIFFQATDNYTGLNEIKALVTRTNGDVADALEAVVYTTTDNGLSIDTEIARSIATPSEAINIEGDWNNDCEAFDVGSNLTDDCFTATFNFLTGWSMASGTDYLIMFERTGEDDTENYYVLTGRGTGSDSVNSFRGCTNVGVCTEESSGRPVFALINDSPIDLLTTRIIDFNPADGAQLTGPTVTFSLYAYVSPEDVGEYIGVRFTLHNIDQNVLLLSAFSPNDIYLLDGFHATSSGYFYFSTSTPIADGNYRINAQLERTYLSGWFVNPFSPINQDLSHQFIVGSSTFVGNLSQNGFSQLNQIFASTTATTTSATAQSCVPLGDFDIIECMAFLFIPGGEYLTVTMQGLKDGVLTRVPWGYLTRVYNIWNTTATSTLPSFTANIQIGPGSDSSPATTTLTFDPGDMIAGAGALLDSIEDPYYGKNARDIFEPMVQLVIALAVLFTILMDLMGSHKHQQDIQQQGRKLS